VIKMKPLKQFVCDECGQIIKNINDGWFEWIDLKGDDIHGFRIVHFSGASPRFKQGKNCYYPEHLGISDNHLKYFTGEDGLGYLLSLFERRLRDPKEVIEMIRRLHIPHYEEARFFFKRAIDEGFIACFDDTQDTLKKIISKYST
jgi:hypothetical protein